VTVIPGEARNLHLPLRAFAAVVFMMSLGVAQTQAQTRVIVSDLGPGTGGRILEDLLRRPHRIVEPDTGWYVVDRSSVEHRNLIVLGRTAAISGRVEGDVLVVGGDLFIRPAAEITGRAIAIGGGVYPSTLARVGQGTESFRDFTYEIRREGDGYRLEYRSLLAHPTRPLLFPLLYGFRVPSYDRVNGLSIPFGPTLTLGGGRAELTGLVTYRSHIGKIDPSLKGRLQVDRRSSVELDAQRGTLSNDDWIWQDYVNSFSTLTFGIDTRNYYRADRAELTLHRLWEFTTTTIEPFVGGVFEKSWRVGLASNAQGGPWSIFGRTDTLAMRRPNPPVPNDQTTYALAGATLDWEPEDLQLRVRSQLESPLDAKRHDVFGNEIGSIQYHQATTDFAVGFLTFGEQSYALDVHWVATLGDTANPQRFVYLGGSGTLPFLDLLEQGGDQLLLIDQRYSIPLLRVRLGLLGIPTLQLRHRLGSAGIGKLPAFEQMVGVGIALTVVRGEIQLEPTSRKLRFGAGFTFSR
jgi:hypothetical protein